MRRGLKRTRGKVVVDAMSTLVENDNNSDGQWGEVSGMMLQADGFS